MEGRTEALHREAAQSSHCYWCFPAPSACDGVHFCGLAVMRPASRELHFSVVARVRARSLSVFQEERSCAADGTVFVMTPRGSFFGQQLLAAVPQSSKATFSLHFLARLKTEKQKSTAKHVKKTNRAEARAWYRQARACKGRQAQHITDIKQFYWMYLVFTTLLSKQKRGGTSNREATVKIYFCLWVYLFIR